MRLFFRAWTSVKRQMGRTLALFLILFLLGVTIVGALSVSSAIHRADQNLRRRLPAIATVISDDVALDQYAQTHGYFPENWSMTPELIEEIGNLPYVRLFDYAVLARYTFFSRNLILPMDSAPYLEAPIEADIAIDQMMAMSLPVEDLETFLLKAVHNPHIADIEGGLISLVEGRAFIESEMEVGANHVAIISQAFADANHLALGDTFT